MFSTIAAIVTAAFIILKVMGLVSFSWCLVWAPIFIYIAVFLVIVISVAILKIWSES